MAGRRVKSALFEPGERQPPEALSKVAYGNPFLPERIAAEQAALGAEFRPRDRVWNVRVDRDVPHPNLIRLSERAAALVELARERIAAGATAVAAERTLYDDLVLYHLYSRYEERLFALIEAPGATRARITFYADFARDVRHYWEAVEPPHPAAHLFAVLFQIRRAFHHIFRFLIGGSLPAARLRAAVWHSVFTHDLRRYRRALFDRLDDVTTLVVGPSGTGKELVARAIGLSRFVALDEKTQRFGQDFAAGFHALNLSALSPTLIESELFGHRRGAFTGALEDRAGWLAACPAGGAVFLDEIGDVEPAIQVKLLRVLQTRTFQRLGDTRPLYFSGKIIAATNRDLGREVQAGRFRADFYYRLCSDVIRTPSLAEQLADDPGELGNLVQFLARRLAGEAEADALAGEVSAWIERHLGAAYAWPGNVRELEQCVRNILIRGTYEPLPSADPAVDHDLVAALRGGALTAEELLERYCALVFAQTGSYQETARRLGVDRRTVKSRVAAVQSKGTG